jgi:outer membrane protein assembly factor BamB
LRCSLAPLILILSGCYRFEAPEAQWLVAASRPPDAPKAGQWAAFRGGLLHGVATDAGLPVDFGPVRNVRWTAEIPGRGNSSPVVAGNRVILTAELPGDPAVLAVLAIDCHTGERVWQQAVGTVRGATHRKNGHATATVASDGTRVYASFGPAGVYCLSIEGQPLWHSPIDDLSHPWGHSSSPVLAGDLVIQLSDGVAGSYLIALDRYSGDVRWKTERASSGCWATPVLVAAQVQGATRWELVVNGTGSTDGSAGYVIAYAPTTGKELWRVHGTTDIPCPTAIVGDGLLVSTSGADGPITAIRPGGDGDVTASHVLWRLPHGGPYVPTGVIVDDHLHLVSDGGILRCLDVRTGAEKWSQRLQRSHSASLVAGDGKIYAASEDGVIHVFAAGDPCQLLAVNRLRQPCQATPAIADGALFVRTEQHLYCFASQATPLVERSRGPGEHTTISTSMAGKPAGN